MYSGKNKGSLATTPSGKISYSQTSETLSGTASTISLLQENNNVNKKITQSKQFVRWFGDWQNSPKTASKVVDGNGEPLVVYHQTGNDFTVFDTKHTGAGEFDSEMPTGIFMKPTSDNIGLRGNKQMALYANIRNPLTVNNRAELVRFYEKNIDGYKDAREDIRYSIDDTKQEEVDFRKALTREEWTSFYSSLNKYNQRDNLHIGDNSILIPDDNNAYNYKLVCYRTDKNNIRVKNVYLIENYDYNIHSNEINVLQILSDYEGKEYSEKQTRAILQNYTGMYGTLFKRYNSVSRKFVKLTRESVSDRRNIKETTDGAGAYENPEREVSGGLSEDKISDIRYAIDDTKQEEVDFRKALTREEWASFYSSLNKYNQRDNLKISKNGILIPDEHNTQDYKLVYYNGNYQSPKVLAVYKLKNFDYTIHDNQMDFEELLNELRRSDENDKYAKAILANNTKVFGTVFERYGGHGWVTIDNTRESVSDRRNIKETADGAGTYENSEREVSGGLSEDKISDIRYAIDDTKSSAEKYSEDDFENKVVYPNMDERQRAQILRNERIKLSSYDSKNALSPDDVASLENSVKRNAFKILRELGTKFNVYENYTN